MKKHHWLILISAAVLVIAETGSRRYLDARFHHTDPYSFYYPHLRSLRTVTADRDTVKIALFGSSVTATPVISRVIKERLKEILGREVRVYNFSFISATIQDGWYQYKWGRQKRFTAIVIYHAVNELRMNSHAERMIAPDFAEFSWYRRRQDVDRFYHPLFQTPCALAYAYTSFLEKHHMIRTSWNIVPFGVFEQPDSLKSNRAIAPFTATYKNIIVTAAQRRETALALTCFYSPPAAKKTIYDRLVGEFNDSIKSVASRSGTIVDLSDLNTQPDLFTDEYHLNEAGQIQLARRIATEIAAVAAAH